MNPGLEEAKRDVKLRTLLPATTCSRWAGSSDQDAAHGNAERGPPRHHLLPLGDATMLDVLDPVHPSQGPARKTEPMPIGSTEGTS